MQPGEEASVAEELQRASNATRLLELSQEALNLLGDQEDSLLPRAGALGRALLALQKLDAAAGELLEYHEQAMLSWNELPSALRQYADRIDIDPNRLAQLEERYNLLQSLKRKYGATLPEVISFGEEVTKKLISLEQRDAELARINGELETAGRRTRCRRARTFRATPQSHSPAGQAGHETIARAGFSAEPF